MATTAFPQGDDAFPSLSAAEVDVRYHAGVLWRGRWLIVVAAGLGLALASLIAYLQTPEYQAQSMVQIEPPVPFFMGVNEALMGGGGYWQNTDFYNTQFRIITSKAVADQVVAELKLKDKEPFRDSPNPKRRDSPNLKRKKGRAEEVRESLRSFRDSLERKQPPGPASPFRPSPVSCVLHRRSTVGAG